MGRLLILSNRFVGSVGWAAATPEMGELRERAERAGVETIAVGPDSLAVVAVRGRARLFVGSSEVSAADGLVVRGMSGEYYELAAAATRVLTAQRSFCLDPLERFESGSASKVATTLDRSDRGVGSDSLILARRSVPPSTEELEALLSTLDHTFPLIAKPSQGRQGRGVVRVTSIDDLRRVLSDSSDDEFLVQPDEDFREEYRVMMLDGVTLGVALKIKAGDAVAANFARGATFSAVSQSVERALIQVASRMTKGRGLVGLDIGVTANQEYFLIEENSAPQWVAFSQATGIDVADAVVRSFLSHTN